MIAKDECFPISLNIVNIHRTIVPITIKAKAGNVIYWTHTNGNIVYKNSIPRSHCVMHVTPVAQRSQPCEVQCLRTTWVTVKSVCVLKTKFYERLRFEGNTSVRNVDLFASQWIRTTLRLVCISHIAPYWLARSCGMWDIGLFAFMFSFTAKRKELKTFLITIYHTSVLGTRGKDVSWSAGTRLSLAVTKSLSCKEQNFFFCLKQSNIWKVL